MKTTIGVDLHKEQMTCVVLDEQGSARERTENPTKCRKQVADYFGSYALHAKVAESLGFYQWSWDLLRPQVGRLCLADPAGVRASAGRNATALARLLTGNTDKAAEKAGFRSIHTVPRPVF